MQGKIYGAITFFGQIFQPFQNSLRKGSHPSPYCKFSPAQGQGKRGSLSRGPFPFLCLIRFRSLLLTESQLISFPLATMMFQFAKSLKSEAEPQHTACPASLDTVSRLETHGSQTVSPHGLSPLKASFLLNAQASIQCILFDAVGIEPTERLPSTIFDHAIYDCVFSSHFPFIMFFVCVPDIHGSL